VGELVERFLAFQKVKFPDRYLNSLHPWETRMKDKFAHIDARELRGRDSVNYINWCIGVEVLGWAPIPSPIAKATANKDIRIVSGAYTHARKCDEFSYRPHFEVHDVSDNVREGFLSQNEFDRVARVISEMGPEYLWLRGFTMAAYELGNRRNELQTLRVGQFDRIARIIRLKGLDTKSGKPRELGVSDELYALLTACCDGKGANDLVFLRYHDRGKLAGKMGPVGDLRKMWRTILDRAGIERWVRLHDFRRSFVNNAIQAGVDRDEIRMYTGHSVSGMHAMISRYHILDRERIIDVARKNEERKLREREIAAELDQARPVSPEVVQ
jgi:integrase